MNFGLRLSVQCTLEESLPRHFEGILEQVELAREAGFDMVAVGQHYLTPPFQAIQMVPALARISAVSGHMKIASAVVLAPLQHPVDLAEQVASLDILSGGRFVLGMALGYREVEYRSFGIRKRDRVARLLESLELMKRLWTEESVTFQGVHFQTEEATMTLRPIQTPYPPIWIGGNTDTAVERAASLGHPWLANPHAHIDTLEQQFQLYRRVEAATNHHEPVTDYPIMLEMFVAENREKAIELAGPHLETKYRAYALWGQDKVISSATSFDVGIEELAPGRYILGSPEQCVEQIRMYQRRLGINHMIVRIQWPGMENKQAMRAIELFGKHIIPAFAREPNKAIGITAPD